MSTSKELSKLNVLQLEQALQAHEDKPSPYPEPAHRREKAVSPEIIEATRQRQKTHRCQATARNSKSAPRPEEPQVTVPTTRKSTRPTALNCRRVRASTSAPTSLPKTTISTPSKRRVEMTPSALAKKIAPSSSKTSREIANSWHLPMPCRHRSAVQMKT